MIPHKVKLKPVGYLHSPLHRKLQMSIINTKYFLKIIILLH